MYGGKHLKIGNKYDLYTSKEGKLSFAFNFNKD